MKILDLYMLKLLKMCLSFKKFFNKILLPLHFTNTEGIKLPETEALYFFFFLFPSVWL